MKKNLLWTLLAALTFVGCSEDELMESGGNALNQNAVTFDTYVSGDAQSRATVVDNTTLKTEGFGVNAWYTEKIPFAAADISIYDKFMTNTKVTFSEEKGWTYSPLKYWPNNKDHMVSFFAYGPYSVNSMVSGTDITFTVAEDVKEQVDLIYHNQTTNKTIDIKKPAVGTKVEFKFDHALSRISFSVEAASDVVSVDPTNTSKLDANTVINVKKVVVMEAGDETTPADPAAPAGPFYGSGTLSLIDGTWSDKSTDFQGFTFTGEHFYRTVKANDIAKDPVEEEIDVVQLHKFNNKQDLLNDESYLMVIPNNDGENTRFNLYIEYDVITETPEGKDVSKITNCITSDTPLEVEFKQGMAYNFNLVLGMTSVQFNVDEVTEWNNATDYEDEEWLPENMEKLDFEIADYDEQTGAHVFLIKSAADLAQMRDNVNSDKTYTLDAVSRSSQVLYYAKASYRQTASFSLAEYENWVPIGRGLGENDDVNKMDVATYAFKGTYDGNNQTIRGLNTNTADHKTYGGVGLFGMVDYYDSKKPLIKNLTIENGNVTNISGNAGGITGFLGDGTIENCSFTGTVNGNHTGGIVGYLYNGKIVNCANGATITSGEALGGIAGWSMGGNIHACYNYGVLNYTGASYTYNGAGGILGFAYVNDTNIIGCYNSASISTSATEVSGNIVGKIFKDGITTGNANVSYCYYSDSVLEAIGANGPNVTPSYVSSTTDWTEAMNYMNYGLNANSIAYHYDASGVNDFPLILADGNVAGEDPAEDEIPAEGYKVTENTEEGTITYTVYTADGLYAWRAAVMNDDESMKDDDINLVLAADITLPEPADGQEYNWKPVGGASVNSEAQCYKGNIDGGGKTITNLVVKFNNSYSGFIGKMKDGTIKNLKLAEVDIKKAAYETVAALLGDGLGMTISGCEVVSGTVNGNAGLIGNIAGSSIENCINRATVTNVGQYAGGVVCNASISCTITNCSNYGNVSLTSSGAPSYYAGGIVGYLSASTVKNCTNDCTSITPAGHVGYIVGTASSSTIEGNKDEGNTGLSEAGNISN